MEPITIPFTPTRADLVELKRVLFTPLGAPPPNPMLPYRIQGPPGERNQSLIRVIVLVGLSLGVYVLIGLLMRTPAIRPANAGATAHWAWHLVGGGAGMAAAIALFAVGVRVSNRDTQNPAPGKDVFYSFRDDGVLEQRPGRRMWFGWGEFHSFAETDNLLVLRVTQQLALYFPKRLFADPQQVASVRELFVNNVVTPRIEQVEVAGTA